MPKIENMYDRVDPHLRYTAYVWALGRYRQGKAAFGIVRFTGLNYCIDRQLVLGGWDTRVHINITSPLYEAAVAQCRDNWERILGFSRAQPVVATHGYPYEDDSSRGCY